MEKEFEQVKEILEKYYESKKNSDLESIKQANNYLNWVLTQTKLILGEKNFIIPKNQIDKIKRGNVFWIDFGFNIHQEFGGVHPALILKTSLNMIIVAPLSSKEPTNEQKLSGVYVEVKIIGGFKPLPEGKSRWINLLDIRSLSIQRIDFNSNCGYVKGFVLDEINEGMNNLWRKPNKKYVVEKTK